VYSSKAHPESSSECECRWRSDETCPFGWLVPCTPSIFTSPAIPRSDSVFLRSTKSRPIQSSFTAATIFIQFSPLFSRILFLILIIINIDSYLLHSFLIHSVRTNYLLILAIRAHNALIQIQWDFFCFEITTTNPASRGQPNHSLIPKVRDHMQLRAGKLNSD